MKAIRQLLAALRKGDETFNLIENNDRIIVGVSGGKDSLALLYTLNLYKKFSKKNFLIQPVLLDLGFPTFNATIIKEYTKSLGLNLIINDSKEVYKILLAHTKEEKHLPCSICSRMKKAAINKVANDLKYNKVAFAHHMDDAIETLLMNEIYGGRIATFAPKMHLEKANITFIRPLIYVREKQIEKLIKEENIPTIGSFCPADKHTTREDIKLYLNNLYKKFNSSYDNFAYMLDNGKRLDLFFNKTSYQLDQDGLTLNPIFNKEDILQVYDIRHKVFVEEQNIKYSKEFKIQEEKDAYSFLIKKKNKAVGTIRYRIFDGYIKIERLAIYKQYRNKEYASKALIFLIEYLKKKYTPTTLLVHAQYASKKLYENLGFTQVGKPFIEAKIKHIKLIKKV